MHATCILAAGLGASMLLSACTHDFDAFKPRGDAGPDGSAHTASLDAEDVDLGADAPDAGD